MKKQIFSMIMVLCLGGCATAKSINETKIFSDIAPIKGDKNAIVTIVSDDGHFESGVILNELMKENELRGTVPGVIEEMKPYVEEWKKIESEGALEIISHSFGHLKMDEKSNVSEQQMKHQLIDAQTYLAENFETDQICFVPPHNTMNKAGYDILNDMGIYAIRQGGREQNSIHPMYGIYYSQWNNLLTMGIGDVITTNERNKWVDDAIKNQTWLIEMWHDVSENGEVGYQPITTTEGDEHLKYIAQKQSEDEIWNASFVDATKYLIERDNVRVKTLLENNTITVDVYFIDNNLSEEIFNIPLTVRIPIPLEWNDKKITTDKDNTNLEVKLNDEGVNMIYIDISPEMEPIEIICNR